VNTGKLTNIQGFRPWNWWF